MDDFTGLNNSSEISSTWAEYEGLVKKYSCLKLVSGDMETSRYFANYVKQNQRYRMIT